MLKRSMVSDQTTIPLPRASHLPLSSETFMAALSINLCVIPWLILEVHFSILWIRVTWLTFVSTSKAWMTKDPFIQSVWGVFWSQILTKFSSLKREEHVIFFLSFFIIFFLNNSRWQAYLRFPLPIFPTTTKLWHGLGWERGGEGLAQSYPC